MDDLQLHVAGATVRGPSIFSALEVPTSREPLAPAIIARWVRPMYFGLQHEGVEGFLVSNLADADDQLIDVLLTNFNWRPRATGAYLAALSGRGHFTDRIGRLLLRSDVCYAGAAYCLALAAFNNPRCCEYLEQYLSYYLRRVDLWFDQGDAMAAIAYLDKQNGSHKLEQFVQQWEVFIDGKPNWDLQNSIKRLDGKMELLRSLQRHVQGDGR